MNFATNSGADAPNFALILILVVVGLYLLLKLTPLGARLSSARRSGQAPSQEVPAESAVPHAEIPAQDHGELVAVITAALMAYAPSGKTLVVRNIRRASAWAKAGRDEQIANRL